MKIDVRDLELVERSARFNIDPRFNLDLYIACSGSYCVSAVECDDGVVIPFAAGTGSDRIRMQLVGFHAVVIDVTEPGGVVFMGAGQLDREPLDGLPPPAPKEPTNVLQATRQRMMDGLSSRESFLNGPPSMYDVPDEDEDVFEEELVERANRQRARRAAKEKEKAAESQSRAKSGASLDGNDDAKQAEEGGAPAPVPEPNKQGAEAPE